MNFPIQLAIILLFSLVGGALATRYKMPSIMGLIITGALIGPYSLGLVDNKEMLAAMIEIGAILLMFSVGIEFNINKIKKFGWRVFAVGLLKMGGMFLIGFYVGRILGLSFSEQLFIGAILTITSTVIFLRVLTQKGQVERKEVPFLVALLVLEDIVGVFMITFFSGFESLHEASSAGILRNLGFSFLILYLTYLISQKIMKPVVDWLKKHESEESDIFISFTVLGIMVYTSIRLDLAPTVGAFLAGNIVANMKYADHFEKAFHPFQTVFAAIFFFCIGANVNILQIIPNAQIILILLVVLIFGRLFTILVSTLFIAEMDLKSAVFCALSMATVGEFSLLIANEAAHMNLTIDIITITTTLIFVTALLMPSLLKLENFLTFRIRKVLPDVIIDTAHRSRVYIKKVTIALSKNPRFALRLVTDWKMVVRHLLIILPIVAFGTLIFSFDSKLFPMKQNVFVLAIISGLFVIFVGIAVGIVSKDIKRIIEEICVFCKIPLHKEFQYLPKVLWNFTALLIVIILMISVPLIDLLIVRKTILFDLIQTILAIIATGLVVLILRYIKSSKRLSRN